MASKSTAPSLRTSSAIRKKEEEEAAAALATAARAAELNAAISQAAQQAAEAASEATGRILRAEAQADRERFERQIADLNRAQVDFIAAGSAPAPAPSPSPEPTSRNPFASQSDVAAVVSSQEPPPAQSPLAKTHPPVPPGDPSPAKPRPSPQGESIASLELALRIARGEIENPSAPSIAGHSPGYFAARDAAGVAGPATSTLRKWRVDPFFPGPTPFDSSLERGPRLQRLSDAGEHVTVELLQHRESVQIHTGYLERGKSNTESRNELDVLYVAVARLDDILRRFERELGSAELCAQDGQYVATYDTHAMLNWRLKSVQRCFQISGGQAPAGRTEGSVKFDFAQERLKRISELPDTAEELAVEKQVALNVAKMQAAYVGRIRFGEQFGKGAQGGAAAAAAAAASLYESEGGVGSSQPGAAAGGAGTGGLRRGGK